MLCMLGSNHVHTDKIRKIHKMFVSQKSKGWECRAGRQHVSTFIQVIFRPFDRRIRKCYACWDPNMFTKIKYVKYIRLGMPSSTSFPTFTFLTNIKIVCILRILSL
jgi:hypothetical protein